MAADFHELSSFPPVVGIDSPEFRAWQAEALAKAGPEVQDFPFLNTCHDCNRSLFTVNCSLSNNP
jgi:uncharacterized protein with PIN domain